MIVERIGSYRYFAPTGRKAKGTESRVLRQTGFPYLMSHILYSASPLLFRDLYKREERYKRIPTFSLFLIFFTGCIREFGR